MMRFIGNVVGGNDREWILFPIYLFLSAGSEYEDGVGGHRHRLGSL